MLPKGARSRERGRMKKLTQRDRVRQHLIERGSITNVEAFQMQILRLSERVRELQATGLKINGDWVRVDGKKTGTFRYTLVEKPEAPKRIVYDLVMRDGVPVRVAREV